MKYTRAPVEAKAKVRPLSGAHEEAHQLPGENVVYFRKSAYAQSIS
ncbi:hypothetical protein A33I_13125 [Alkalihalophilus marmarensis DSM 21297]|uniref:Uncharacterized protein n=1 Tax=Alkalihalophilus marmarensis DSM 21297 TaxID=1188261 RepID=U6SQA5_9BACI|nr:hypothetical protein A33I_13125 [Alkalihalophilus marmarensis DSM 21297]